MRIREFESPDSGRLAYILSQQKIECDLPDFSLFPDLQVLTDVHGVIRQGIGIRPLGEAYLFIDHGWENPALRFAAFQQLHDSMAVKMRAKGVLDIAAFIPPRMERSFGRRLMKELDWFRPLWPCFAKDLRKAG